jgi:hypothetical protein
MSAIRGETIRTPATISQIRQERKCSKAESVHKWMLNNTVSIKIYVSHPTLMEMMHTNEIQTEKAGLSRPFLFVEICTQQPYFKVAIFWQAILSI